jgi:hypothetical protein
MRLTLAQAKASTLMKPLGIAPCNPDFLDLLNNAMQRLVDAGRWWGCFERMRYCLNDGCITWPREVAAVEAFRVCNRAMPVRNMWFEFQETVPAPRIDDLNKDNGPAWGPWSKPMLLDRTNYINVCQFLDWGANVLPIKIYPAIASDANGTNRVLLQGLDANGLPIRTLDTVTGVYVDGVYVTLATPFVQSPFSFSGPRLTGAQKPITNGRLDVYVVNADLTETLIASWEPSETNPSYRRSYVYKRPSACGTGTTNATCANNGDGCETPLANCSMPVAEAIIRREFVPAVVDSDWLMIGNLQALACGMKAVQWEQDGEEAQSEAQWSKAIALLRNELKKYGPRDQTTIEVELTSKCERKRYAGFW